MTGPQLTTHVLDLAAGRPAHGVGIALYRLDGSEAAVLVRTRTNRDGRTDAPLLAGDSLTSGQYELAFEVGDYFAGESAPPAPPFLDVVPVRFGVAAGIAHLHIALLITPWSYTTYRGS